MTLSEHLISARKERGFTQRDLAKQSGVSPAEVSRIETGQRQNPSPAILRAFADALVVDFETLMELAGYVEENGQKEKKLSVALADPDGKLRNLYMCAEEMYETDMEWLQTAYFVAKELDESDRELVRSVVESLCERLRK